MKQMGFLITILFLVQFLHAEIIAGKLYEKDSDHKLLLYNFQSQITKTQNGLQISESQYTDPAGNIIIEEHSEREGIKLKKFQIDHKQTGRKGSIEVNGGKISFSFEDNGKKKKIETEDLPNNFVVGPTLAAYVLTHWSELLNGKTIDIRFGVWDRQETVGFSLFKIGQEKIGGKDVILLKFKPTSFVIAALVDPVIFKFSSDGKELVSMIGRVPPKFKVSDKWKDLDAEVLYSYK